MVYLSQFNIPTRADIVLDASASTALSPSWVGQVLSDLFGRHRARNVIFEGLNPKLEPSIRKLVDKRNLASKTFIAKKNIPKKNSWEQSSFISEG